MSKEYLLADGRLVLSDEGLISVPNPENLNDLADENGALATQYNNLTDEIKELIINGVVDGSPREIYNNLSALQNAYPNGASGVYLTADNDHWYYYKDGWQDGGLYHSIEIIFKYKGTVENFSDLPTNAERGHIYTIKNADNEHNIKMGDNVCFDGTNWNVISGFVDLNNIYTKTETNNLLNNKANKADVYTKSEVNNSLNSKLDKSSVLQATGTSTSETISQKVITDNLNLKVNKSDIVNTHVGMSTVYPMTQSAVKNNFWHTFPIDSEVGPSKPAVSNRLFKTGFYVTTPTDNPVIPPAWDSNYDPCPGGTGYGSLLNIVNNGAAGIYRQQAQFYFAEGPKNLYWRFAFNGQDHSDTSNWGTWRRLVNYDEISSGVKLTNSSSSSITFNRIDYPDSRGMTIYTGERYFSSGLQKWTLPGTMRSTNYRILLTPCNYNSNSSYMIPNIYNKTTTSCTVYASNSITYSYLIIETW